MKVEAANIPDELRARAQWVAWRGERRKDKVTKVPYSAASGRPASSTNPATWATFEAACKYAEMAGMDGVGYVFSSEDPYAGVDLDHGRRADGTLAPWAFAILQELDSYAEVSPSGAGVHVILRGTVGGGRKKSLPEGEGAALEMYDRGRFFTVTGDRLDFAPTQIEERGEVLTRLLAWEFGPASQAAPSVEVGSFTLRADAVPPFDKWEALKENSSKARLSWERRRSDLQDQSASGYDLSLATFAAQAGWSDQEIVDLLIAARRKHADELHLNRPDKYALTLRKARQGTAGGRAQEEAMDVLMVVREQQTNDSPEPRVPTLEEARQIVEPDDRRAAILASASVTLGANLQRLVKYRSDPPSYRLETAAGQVLLEGVANLIEHRRLRQCVAAAAGVYLKDIPKARWPVVAQALLDACEEESAGEEATERGQARAWLADYLTDRHVTEGEDVEDAVAMQQPHQREGRICVFGGDFRRWLRGNGQAQVSARAMGTTFRAYGCVPHTIPVVIDGRRTTRSVWLLPIDHE